MKARDKIIICKGKGQNYYLYRQVHYCAAGNQIIYSLCQHSYAGWACTCKCQVSHSFFMSMFQKHFLQLHVHMNFFFEKVSFSFHIQFFFFFLLCVCIIFLFLLLPFGSSWNFVVIYLDTLHFFNQLLKKFILF